MKELRCSCGQSIRVPDSAFDEVKVHGWNCHNEVVRTTSGGKTIPISHYIMGEPPPGYEIDHIDLDSHNNLEENLRLCTRSQNNANQGKKKNRTGYRGVEWTTASWRYQLTVNGVKHRRAGFATAKAAALARDEVAREHFGPHARYNFPLAGEQQA